MNEGHEPVLVEEFLSFFVDKSIHCFIDATIGMGGHSKALLSHHPEIELLIGLDEDQEALNLAEKNLSSFQSKIRLIHGNFRHLHELVSERAEGILFDLGVSSMQLDKDSRGFSFMHDGPLDMRKDQSQKLTAAIVVNTYPEQKLSDIFWQYGEEHRSRRAAKAIVEARRRHRIQTTQELVSILKPILTWRGRKSRHIHPMTLVFQALRIEVNDELDSLKEAIPKALGLLNPGGRMGIICFQSLEDRIVKECFREFHREKSATLLTKKPMTAKSEEIARNPRSRSSKMRFIEKI